MTDPHVLQVRSSSGLYGAEYVVLGLVPALAKAGIRSTLLSIHNPRLSTQHLLDRARALGVPVEELSCRSRFDLRTIWSLRRRMLSTPNAIIHVHDYKSALYAWLARGRSHVPIVSTSHGQFADTVSLRVYQSIELALMKRFDHVCIVSEPMRRLLLDAGVRAERVSYIHNGIDTVRFDPGAVRPLDRASIGAPEGTFVFGAAMRLDEQKFPLGLVEAFAASRDSALPSVLLFAGDGPLRPAIEARTQELGLEGSVRLLGARNDLERFYATLDAFVLPSLYEGLPLALLEAMAMATPVVATSVGQVPEVLMGLPARLVPPGDVAALSTALRSVRTGPAPVAGLRDRVQSLYSVARMADAYAEIYRTVGASGGRRAKNVVSGPPVA